MELSDVQVQDLQKRIHSVSPCSCIPPQLRPQVHPKMANGQAHTSLPHTGAHSVSKTEIRFANNTERAVLSAHTVICSASLNAHCQDLRQVSLRVLVWKQLVVWKCCMIHVCGQPSHRATLSLPPMWPTEPFLSLMSEGDHLIFSET